MLLVKRSEAWITWRMMRDLFGDECELIARGPRHRTLAGHIVLLTGGGGGGVMAFFVRRWHGFGMSSAGRQRVPALENFAENRVVGLLGHGTFAASVKRRHVPLDHLNHTLAWILDIRYSLFVSFTHQHLHIKHLKMKKTFCSFLTRETCRCEQKSRRTSRVVSAARV